MFKRILITGISGSGGSYLADWILANKPGVEVHGFSRWHSAAHGLNLADAGERVTVHECDLTDLSAVVRQLKASKPDCIFHLASYANVREAFTTPLAVIHNNVMATANLLEGIRLAELDPTVQICSTSEVYGEVHESEVPIKEETPFRPNSPYAVSKVAQDLLGWTYFRSYGMKTVRTRMFAYFNPRRTDLFATAFARQVARIEAGHQKVLRHGNLDSTRTMIDVRDAMESYWVAAEKCDYGQAYNIGGATTIRVGEFLNVLKKLATTDIPSSIDEKLLRPADVTLQIPDVSKFEKATGWKPKIAFEDSVEHLLGYWRERVRREEGPR